MSETDNELAPVVVRRIVVPMGDIMRLTLQVFCAFLVLGVLLWLVGMLLMVATGRALFELLF